MTPSADDRSPSALQAWVRALERTAPVDRGQAPALPVLLAGLGKRFNDMPALTDRAGGLTYHDLSHSINRYARWAVEQDLRPGDVVCLLMHNCPDYMPIWLGLTRARVVVALINTHLTGDSLAHSINIVSPHHVIVAARLSDTLRSTSSRLRGQARIWVHGGADPHLPRIDLEVSNLPAELPEEPRYAPPSLDDRALLIYTSGTTGLPKAANVSHRRLAQWSHWFSGMMDTQAHDRMYNCLPLYHSVGGVVATGATLVSGGTVVLRERFSAREFWKDVVTERCTLFQYIGELCRYLTAAPVQPDETRHGLRLCCGNGLRFEVWAPFQERFRIPRILEYYAATEGSFSLYNCEGKPGAIGRIPPFLSHRVPVALVKYDPVSGIPLRDEAGRCIRCAPNEAGEAIGQVMSADGRHVGRFEGYADRAASQSKLVRDAFAAGDAWYRTGDLLRQDEQGFFYFVDRVGDTFRWKGENVSTTEVAAAISACPGIAEAVVYGVSVPAADGRAGMAAIVIDAQFDLLTLRIHLTRLLPDYARPVFLRLVPAIEQTGTFKLRKQQLVEAGYDPALVPDPLFFYDRVREAYLPIDADVLSRLRSGQLHL